MYNIIIAGKFGGGKVDELTVMSIWRGKVGKWNKVRT